MGITPHQASWVGAELAARALDKASAADDRVLAQAFRDWFPNADAYYSTAEMAAIVRTQLEHHSALIQQRRDRLTGQGRMTAVGRHG
jgi:hypothetical protein